MKNKLIKLLVFISFSLLFVSIANTYLSIKLWDYDFWWHLATGRYIVENRTLPEKDPFSFSNNLEENKNLFPEREKFILKQYWLAQVLFYEIYDKFGDKGIIVLRSLLLFSVIVCVFLWFQTQKIGFYITYPFVFFVFAHTLTFTGERPVLFTFLFAVLTILLLDDFKRRKSKLIFFLIPLMIVWSNLHGGFILGIVFILTYIVGETINFLVKRPQTDRKALMTLYVVGIFAIAASFINPNGINILSLFSEQKIFEKGTQEYYSIFSLYKSKIRAVDIEYIILIAIFPLVAIIRRKKIDVIYYLLIGGLLYMSISALRYVIYYVCISSMILGRELYYICEDFFTRLNVNRVKLNLVASSLILISSILYAGGFLNFEKVTFAEAEMFTVPKGAADFIIANNIQGNMFNDMGFGGYLIWRFYPQKKVFIDTRQLNYTLIKEFEWITYSTESIMHPALPKGKKPLWKRLLDHYRINIIVIDTADVFGAIKPIFFSLIKSDDWVPVYHDFISVVFLRENKEDKQIIDKYRLADNVVYDGAISRLTQWALYNKKNPLYLTSLGDIFYNMERYQDALTAYTYAYNRFPGEEAIKIKLEDTQKMLKKAEIKGKVYEE
jgi:hypothetical protein